MSFRFLNYGSNFDFELAMQPTLILNLSSLQVLRLYAGATTALKCSTWFKEQFNKLGFYAGKEVTKVTIRTALSNPLADCTK